jgi:NTP pyrophosphatase (non-canonical NTP hydrolase)
VIWGEHNQHLPLAPTGTTLGALMNEVTAARAKFPGNRHLLAALTEEVGELAQAMLQKQSRERIQKEALQVACVALRILEEGDAAFSDLTAEEWQP